MPEKDLIKGTERSEGKRYSPQLRCVCGHLDEKHAQKYFTGPLVKNHHWDKNSCFYHTDSMRYCPCLTFKLNNLSLIESIALERGLI